VRTAHSSDCQLYKSVKVTGIAVQNCCLCFNDWAPLGIVCSACSVVSDVRSAHYFAFNKYHHLFCTGELMNQYFVILSLSLGYSWDKVG
jgi:hypothetical protein